MRDVCCLGAKQNKKMVGAHRKHMQPTAQRAPSLLTLIGTRSRDWCCSFMSRVLGASRTLSTCRSTGYALIGRPGSRHTVRCSSSHAFFPFFFTNRPWRPPKQHKKNKGNLRLYMSNAVHPLSNGPAEDDANWMHCGF